MAAKSRADAAASHTPGGAGATTQPPTPRYDPTPDELQRDIDDLLALLAGVPRTTPT